MTEEIVHVREVYIIQNRAEPHLYWSMDGWGCLQTAEIYTHKNYHMPMEGIFVALLPEIPLEIEEDYYG